MLAIMPTAEEGVFDLVAAKRGKRLAWPRKDDAEKDDAIELAELIRERPVKATEAREMAQKLFNSKARGESLTGNNNSRYYGTEEALENLRKTVFLHP